MSVNAIDPSDPFELAIEAAPSGVLVASPDGTIVLVNRELERMFGYARADLIGHSVTMVLPNGLRSGATTAGPTASDAARQLLDDVQDIGRRQDGTGFPVRVQVTEVERGGHSLLLASVMDVTERRRREAASRRAVEEQTAFERMVAELSGYFMNVPQDEIDQAIGDALCRIGTLIDIDRAAFYRVDKDRTFNKEVIWGADGIELSGPSLSAANRFPWTVERLMAGEDVVFSSLDKVPHECDARGYRESLTKSALTTPLVVAGHVVGALAFHAIREERHWRPESVHRTKLISAVFGQALAWQDSNTSLRNALAEVRRLQDELQADNSQLRREISQRMTAEHVVGQSGALRRAMELVHQVAQTDSTVLLLGETGTGKEVLASEIHALSARRNRTMVRVNCGAIPATLIESELFGREKGAFTGALARQVGRFELASGSTIFLDEIGDLPLETQVKLLRVLQERQIERLGSPQPIAVDTRIIAATHRDLERRMAEGAFRQDLYYRLNVFPIHVPPLRERLEDIPGLVWSFVDEFARAFGKHVDTVAEESLAALQQYSWPGNLRELRNVVERAMITATDRRLVITLPQPSAAAASRSQKLMDVERQHIRSVLESSGWRIRGADGAAVRLGLKPTTLETRMAKLGLRRPRQLQVR